MFTINTYDYDCTKKCKCPEHGKTITYALTKRSVADSKLAAFIAKTCRNFTDVLDYEGRSSLHLAASVNRYTITEWLINNGANINLRDEESLQTPLHRAIWYGNISIAVLLLKFGATLDVVDSDFKIPLQYTCRPHAYRRTNALTKEMVLWGGNKNYNLGIGDEQERIQPQQIEEFRKNNITIDQVSISIYHTIFLTDRGEVYCVGHGKGGRLGIGVEYTLVTPKKVQIAFKHANERVIAVSAGRYHTLILTDSDNIYATGMNNHNQLGVKSAPENLLVFKEISNLMKLNGKNMRGVKAHDTYSLAYSSNEIFVWGTNGGQFGIKKEINPVPMLQELPINNIEKFDSGNTAIACYTTNKYLYVFSRYKTKSFKTPKLEAITQLLVVGTDGHHNENQNQSATQATTKILILTESQSVYMWHEDIQKYVKCIFPVAEFSIDRMVRCSKRVVFVSDGELYTGNPIKFNYKKVELGAYQETYNKKDICDMTKVKFELKRIPYVSRALDVMIDETGENFVVLQESPSNYLTVPKIEINVPNFQMLRDEANEHDAVHDVVFHVDYRKFAGHKYIVSCRAPGLGDIIRQYPDKNIHLNYERLTGNIFEAILNFIYTNRCLTVNEIFELYPPNTDKKDALNSFRQFLEKFHIKDYTIEAYSSNRTQMYPKFDRKMFAEYHDIKIKCLNNQIINAHKCMLVGRLEYFNMMFSHTWSENDVINLSNISIDYMELIINWLYTHDFNFIYKNQNYTENFIYQMIILCDQFFIDDLKLHYEILLLERLNIKNCGYMLELSNFYNCVQLEDKCLEYICCNIDRIIELGSLNNLEAELLNKINKKYADLFKTIEQRVITPYTDTIDDEFIEAFVNNFKINLSGNDGNADHESAHDTSFDNSRNGKLSKKGKNKLNRQSNERTKYEKVVLADSSNRVMDNNVVDVKIKNANEDKISAEIIDPTKSSIWTTVTDKKNDSTKTKKLVKVNEILRNEKKDENKFINLNLVLKNGNSTPPSSADVLKIENDVITSPGRNAISLADFTPIKKEKLSQKQRKRLSSESGSFNPIIVTTPTKPTIEKSIASPPIGENVWKSSPPINIPSNNSMNSNRSSSAMLGPSPTSPILTNFHEIQQDEKKQKEYYHRMKSKSLMLTQIEEKAIEELQKFYNCDNVFDETITIERKSRITINCAIWQHQ